MNGGEITGFVVAGFVAVIHVYFFLLEAVMWRGRARRVFKMSAQLSNDTASLAANQGVYNLLLAVGVAVSVASLDHRQTILFLALVLCAGTFGAASVSTAIMFVQALPALVGILLLAFAPDDITAVAVREVVCAVVGGLVCWLMGWLVFRREKTHREQVQADRE